jgi:hypothetical protein
LTSRSPRSRPVAERRRPTKPARRARTRSTRSCWPGLQRTYDLILAQGRGGNPESDSGWGRRKRPAAVNLLDRLTTHREQVLRFSVELAVPFTNNLAEQDIRGVKIRQKISGCLRSMTGAQIPAGFGPT